MSKFALSLLAASMIAVAGCSDRSQSGLDDTYRICLGDLFLEIPAEEAGLLRVDGRGLTAQKPQTFDAASFSSDPSGFDLLIARGESLSGIFFISISEQEIYERRSPDFVPRGDNHIRIGEFFDAPAFVMLPFGGDSGLNGPRTPGAFISLSAPLTDRSWIRVSFRGNEIGLDQMPDYLSALEAELIRWSSGRISQEPDGNLECRANR